MTSNESTILLQDIWQIDNTTDYKVHFARYNQYSQPLDVWVWSPQHWQQWQEYKSEKQHDFNRTYIFSLMRFYHEPDTWLFGGIFQVLGFSSNGKKYKVQLTKQHESFIGRLKILSDYQERKTRVKLEKHFSNFKVKEILSEPYSGRAFPGFESIDLSFGELESLIQKGRPDWKAALESVKGIYLITDISSGKRYVGAAYGNQGVWSRWSNYISSGHGGNAELRSLVSKKGIDYCRKSFRFALLEFRPTSIADHIVIDREGFWKSILLTRGKQGLNRN